MGASGASRLGLRLRLRPRPRSRLPPRPDATCDITRHSYKTRTFANPYNTDRDNRKSSSPVNSVKAVQAVQADFDAVHLKTFRDQAFVPERPLVFRARANLLAGVGVGPLPALRKWFKPLVGDRQRPVRKVLAGPIVSQPWIETSYPFELEYPQANVIHGDPVLHFLTWLRARNKKTATGSQLRADEEALEQALRYHVPRSGSETAKRGLLRFNAPMSLLDNAIKFNLEREEQNPMSGIRKLYIAQASLNNLPPDLQRDVTTPRLVSFAGKGDVYDSSLWLGLEPTYTPLHRDPNPNLFIQLCSTKVVRLLPPQHGESMYHTVQRLLGASSGNSRIRGAEMMEGPERDAMLKAVWWHDRPMSSDFEVNLAGPRAEMQETILDPGDALFIPKGWWHSIRSLLTNGRLNGSVNWWFR